MSGRRRAARIWRGRYETMRHHKALCGTIMALALAVPVHGAKSTKKGGKLDKALSLAVVAASQFDAATTYHVLNSSPYLREGNPLIGGAAKTPAIFPVLAGTALATDWVASRLKADGHPKAGRAIKFVAIGVHVFAGAHNLRVGR